jgi:putative ABC transport system permease protein
MPDWKAEIRQRLTGSNLPPAREAALVEELAQDLEDCYAELLAGGASEVEAYEQTLAELSGSEFLTWELRRAERQITQEPLVLGTNRRTNMIAALWQDLRFGARMLMKNPGFTLIAVITLALGIGANTAIFSVADKLLLRSLPVKNPQQLALVSGETVNPKFRNNLFSYPNYMNYCEQNEVFSDLLAFNQTTVRFGAGEQSGKLGIEMVSGNYFDLLGGRRPRARHSG